MGRKTGCHYSMKLAIRVLVYHIIYLLNVAAHLHSGKRYLQRCHTNQENIRMIYPFLLFPLRGR